MLTLTQQSAQLRHLLARLHPLSDEAWQAAECRFRPHQFAAGQHIFSADVRVNELYFHVNGIARFYYLHPNGKEFNKSFASPGQVLGSLSSVINGEPSRFFVQALTLCQCLSLPYTALQELGEQHHDWQRLSMRLLEQLALKKEQREADFLLLSASERYQKFLQEYAQIADLIANYHIASYLGITEVALSRIRGRLKLT